MGSDGYLCAEKLTEGKLLNVKTHGTIIRRY